MFGSLFGGGAKARASVEVPPPAAPEPAEKEGDGQDGPSRSRLSLAVEALSASQQALEENGDVSITEPLDEDQLGATFTAELDEESQRLNGKVFQCQTRVDKLEDEIREGDRAQARTAQDHASALRNVGDAMDQLKAHRDGLTGMKSEFERQAKTAREKVAEKITAMQRLEKEVADQINTTISARARAEEVKLTRVAAVATGQTAVLTAFEDMCQVGVTTAAAEERLASMSAVVAAMKEHIEAHNKKVQELERESDFHTEAHKKTATEHSQSKGAAEVARDRVRASTSALSTHNEDAGKRQRAHEAEVRRAKELAAAANNLRDMRSRSALLQEDQGALDDLKKSGEAAAAAAAEAVRTSLAGLEATKSADDTKKAQLSTVKDKAETDLAQRTKVTASVAERLVLRDRSMRESKAAYTSAMAALEAAKEEHAIVTARVVGPLTEEKKAGTEALKASKEAQVESAKKAGQDEMPLRHDEEAENLVLRKAEDTERNLIQGLVVAKRGLGEAEADAIDLVLDAPPAEKVPARGRGGILVFAERESCIGDREAMEKKAKAQLEEANAAVAAAKTELADLEKQDDKTKTAIGKAKLEEKEQAARDATTAVEAAAASLEAASGNLKALSEMEAHPVPPSTVVHVESELKLVDQCLERHSGAEGQVKETAGTNTGEWEEIKTKLQADLHRAELELRMAIEDKAAAKEFRKNVGAS